MNPPILFMNYEIKRYNKILLILIMSLWRHFKDNVCQLLKVRVTRSLLYYLWYSDEQLWTRVREFAETTRIDDDINWLTL